MLLTLLNVSYITNFFQINPFDGVIGCIDGTFIPIMKPEYVMRSTWVNRHDLPSMTLQAICDSKRRFIDVFTGPPSRMHDARVYTWSRIDRELQLRCGERFHIVGDGAYQLERWLLTPFRDLGHLTEQQRQYNTALSQTRILIENAFGILKMRFRQLYYGVHMHDPAKIATFIICCCVLHNLCIDDNLNNLAPPQPVNLNDDGLAQIGNQLENGVQKRNRIANAY